MGTVCVVGDYVVAMDPGAPVLRDAAVAIEQGRVIGLGPAREVIEAHRPELVVGGKGRVVVPGLIDAHVHSRERLAAFLFPDTVAPDEWMARYAMPYHASLDERAERVAVELQLATMALQGVSLYVEAGYVHLSAHLDALRRIRLRSILCPWLWDLPEFNRTSPDEVVRVADELERSVGEFKGRVSCGLAPISASTCSPELIREAKRVASERGWRIYVHAASTLSEVERVASRTGMTPIRYLESLGVLDRDTVLVHAVYLDSEDVSRIARSGSGVVVCPVSGAMKGKGLSVKGRYLELIRSGVRLCVGTDGGPSSRSFSPLRAAAFLALLLKDLSSDPAAFSSGSVLSLTTTSASEVAGVRGAGRITVGGPADLAVFDLRRSVGLLPLGDPVQALAYGDITSTAEHLIVAGEFVVRDHSLVGVDVEALLEEAQEVVEALR
ncbi:MAG: amidohydrolase family protein [Nitrososphaerota archaeon]|nr:amidohydrolase family protein [Candidatus Calditenuis fumarioli]